MIKPRHSPPSTASSPVPLGPATSADAPVPPAADTPLPETQTAAGPATGESPSKGDELGEQIGHRLKAMFQDVVAEPVPEKFRQLLEELERKSAKS
jgi:hypothetical protein